MFVFVIKKIVWLLEYVPLSGCLSEFFLQYGALKLRIQQLEGELVELLSNYWRASVASETLTGVKMKKSGMFICIYVWTYVCHFVL